LGGVSTADIVKQRYGTRTYQEARNEWYRNGRDGFLTELGKYNLGERDLAMNVNFFSKVTVDAAGAMHFQPGNSQRGAYVDLRAEMNTLIVLNTCVHPLDLAPVYAPKPVQLTIYASPPPAADDLCRNSRPENQRGFLLTERYFL
jgi:uncharacterized protein YcgI (DUF1989 family)